MLIITESMNKGEDKMNEEYNQLMIETALSLSTLAAKGTASIINKKVRAAKEIKDAEKQRTTYESIINELLQEREDAVRIAQIYKSELDKIVISDEDIKHLNATVTRLLDLFKGQIPSGQQGTLETIKGLISADTLKTMQLLGFNYKAAIGEPLTQLCANAISQLAKKGTSNNSQIAKRK